uniref:Uncharacterized protein n=1 Tax=Wuchereria bancrofti TaxID=6293 RepID=A0AAF5RTS1_WUCBA
MSKVSKQIFEKIEIGRKSRRTSSISPIRQMKFPQRTDRDERCYSMAENWIAWLKSNKHEEVRSHDAEAESRRLDLKQIERIIIVVNL